MLGNDIAILALYIHLMINLNGAFRSQFLKTPQTQKLLIPFFFQDIFMLPKSANVKVTVADYKDLKQ